MRRSLKTRLATTAVILSSLTIGAVGCADSPGQRVTVGEPVSVVMEDDLGADCLTSGNLMCGPVMMDEDRKTAAWNTWDAQQGWTLAKVDPTREFRVDLGNYSTEPMHQKPGTVVLASSDGFYYTYVVTYP